MNDYEKLNHIIQEIETLIKMNVNSYFPEFIAWNKKVERFLVKKYGDSSTELNQFREIPFKPPWLGRYVRLSGSPEEIQEAGQSIDKVRVDSCKNGLYEAKAVLESILEDLNEEYVSNSYSEQDDAAPKMGQNVFIVHGHNKNSAIILARQLERQGIKPIIFGEVVNSGTTTIIEKIERYSNVSAAICLFTADDIGRTLDSEQERKRARQNVIFEAGYFIGKIGRQRVILIVDREVEMPSDLSGIVHIAYSTSENWKEEDVLRELKEIGFDIDFKKMV